MAPSTPTPTTTIQQQQPGENRSFQRYKNVLFGLGITEVVIGCLSVLLGIVSIAITQQELNNYYYNYYYPYFNGYSSYTTLTYSAQGIWCGILVVVTGILGIRFKYNQSKSLYIANMIIALITSCIGFGVVVLSGIAAGLSQYSSALVAIHSTITILIFVAFVIAVMHSAFCCSGICSSEPASTTPQTTAPALQQNIVSAHYVQGRDGQLILVTNQPMVSQGAIQTFPQAPSSNPYFQPYPTPPQPYAPPFYEEANVEKDRQHTNEKQ